MREEENSVKHAAGERKNISSLTKTSAKKYPKFPLRRGIDKEREEEKKRRNDNAFDQHAKRTSYTFSRWDGPRPQTVSLTDQIESNLDNTFAKPNEKRDRHVDSKERVEEMKREVLKAGESGEPISVRRGWPDFEKFLTEGQQKEEYKEIAKKKVDWERIRKECTKLACALKLYYKKPRSYEKDGRQYTEKARAHARTYLYEKNEDGVWSLVSNNGTEMTKRLVELYGIEED